MREASGFLELGSEGDTESAYAAGQCYSPDLARWTCEGDVAQGETDTGASVITLPLDPSTDRRRCFALLASGTTVKRINTDFGFAGGSPTEEIDLDDYPWGGSTTTVAAIKCADLWVMTDRFFDRELTLASPALGRWYFIEGETLAEHRVWDPAT